MSVKTILKLNKRFRILDHPFNRPAGVQAEGPGGSVSLAYAQWEYERAAASLSCFAPYYAPGDILFRKKVLDVGCGAGGKSIWYAEKWAADVTGVELLEKYRDQAEAFAMRNHIGPDPVSPDQQDPYSMGQAPRGSFRFICADASDTGLPSESFDTIIMNDAFEHLADPEAVLAECGRLLKPGGRVFINFPPYGHPYGEHLSDLIGIPWVHRLFPEQQCLEAYRQLAEELDAETEQYEQPGRPETERSAKDKAGRPAVSGAERIAFRISEDKNGALNNSYINKMSLKRFAEIRKELATQASGTVGSMSAQHADGTDSQRAGALGQASASALKVVLYRELPLRKWLAPLAKIPGIKENFVRMAVCVLEKT